MKSRLLILLLIVIIGIGSYGLYYFFNREQEPTRGTFIYKNIEDVGDEYELHNLYKSSDQSFFI